MSKFEYTMPSGAKYVVLGPDNATQLDADKIFYQQIAAGSLVGYSAGQTLADYNIPLAPLEYSRLIRGTAGIAGTEFRRALANKIDLINNIISSVYPVANDISSTISQLIIDGGGQNSSVDQVIHDFASNNSGLITTGEGYAFIPSNIDVPTIVTILQNLPHATDVPDLFEVPIQDPVNSSSVINARGPILGPTSVGPLTPQQIQALQAQISNLVDQDYTKISQDKGIGKYGFTCYQLEKVGYVKPWTYRYIEQNPENFISTMKSPSIWLGKNGINSLDELLADEVVQNKIQNELMDSGYTSLTASGVITQAAQPEVTSDVGWIYTPSGLQPSTDITNLGGDLGLLGQFAFATSTNYSTLNSGIVNSNSPADINLTQYDYSTAQKIISGRTTGDVGTVTSNASKFGSEATSLWAISGGSDNLSKILMYGTTGTSGYVLNKLAGLPMMFNNNNLNYGATGVNSMVNNFTNFGSVGLYGLPISQQASKTTGMLNTYGRSAQYAMNFMTGLGTGASMSTLTNNLANLGTNLNFGGRIPGASGINGITGFASSLNGLNNVNSIDGAFTTLGGMATRLTGLGKFGSLSQLSKNLGGMGALLGSVSGLFGGQDPLVSGVKQSPGYSNTVNRSTLDAAVSRTIGDPRITTPIFGYPSTQSLGAGSDIAYAKSQLQKLGVTPLSQ